MPELGTTRLSAKGQVVIPENIRNRLGLQKGAQFIVVGESDIIILKTITTPSMRDFDGLIEKVRKQAQKVGLKKADVKSAIASARRHNE